MATDNPTATRTGITAVPPPESESDGFGVLQHRLFSAVQRLKLAVDKFDYDEVPEDHIPAVFVVEEATLAQIHDDYDAWHMQHVFSAKHEELFRQAGEVAAKAVQS
jgi:hypothetical protein